MGLSLVATTLILYLGESPLWLTLVTLGIILTATLFTVLVRFSIDANDKQLKLGFRLLPVGKTLAYADIETIEVIDIHAIGDFGGWGYRYNPFTGTIGYIMEGEKGIMLTTKAGKKIAFTVRDMDRLLRVLRQQYPQLKAA